MQKSNHSVPAPTKGATPPAKPRQITKKVRTAIDALIKGTAKTHEEAAAIAGCARESVSRALKRPEVLEEIRLQVERQLKGKTLARAAGKLDKLIDADSENVAFRATELALGLNGFQPPQRGTTVQTNVNVGWTIDLRTNADGPGKVVGDHSTCGGVIIDAEPVEEGE
ncbi:helix-turn-helix domain-containing protein [Azospirillum argentinense]